MFWEQMIIIATMLTTAIVTWLVITFIGGPYE